MPKFWKDALERVLWTAAQAAVAAGAVYVADLPAAWIPVGTVIVAALKALVAGQVGDPTTAKFDSLSK